MLHGHWASKESRGSEPQAPAVTPLPLCSEWSVVWKSGKFSFSFSQRPRSSDKQAPKSRWVTGLLPLQPLLACPLGFSCSRPVSLWVDWIMTKLSTYLCEVPALDEVTCHVTSCLPMDRGGNVMPGHPRRRVSINEVCPGAPGKIINFWVRDESHLTPVLIPTMVCKRECGSVHLVYNMYFLAWVEQTLYSPEKHRSPIEEHSPLCTSPK